MSVRFEVTLKRNVVYNSCSGPVELRIRASSVSNEVDLGASRFREFVSGLIAYPVDEFVFSKHSESIAGSNDWAYALSRDVCPDRKLARRTASVRFEVSGVPLWMDFRRDWLLSDQWESLPLPSH